MKRTLFRSASMSLAALIAASSTIAAQPGSAVRVQRLTEQTQPNAFTWSGELSANQRVIVRSLIGNITVEPGRGRTLEVVATKRWRRGRPAEVTIDATRASSGNVVICARWTTNTACNEDGYRTRVTGNNNNDTQVDFIIRLPAGSGAALNTTLGNIDVTGSSGAIDASTTNGNVRVESSDGEVDASTTNGHIDVRLTKLPARGATYSTTNGSITVSLPDGTDADLEARTTNGRIDTDFPVTITGSISRRSLRGTIGRGGPLLTLSTTNGTIRIEKR